MQGGLFPDFDISGAFFIFFFSFLANWLMLLSRVMIQKSLIFANKQFMTIINSSISNCLEIMQPRSSLSLIIKYLNSIYLKVYTKLT